MNLGSAIAVLLRRWLVVLLGLALTLGAAAYLYRSTPPSYQSTASLLLLLPADARGSENVGSPYLYLPSGLNVMARLVAGAPNRREAREELAAAGVASSFQVGVDPTTPILNVSAEGGDPENVVLTRDLVVELLRGELLTMQEEEGVPPWQTAHTRLYNNDDVPQQLGGEWRRAVLAAMAAGGLATLLFVFGLDRLLAIRAERKRAASEPE